MSEPSSRPHYFLFDLDGTLVLTDTIYHTVWQQILERYHLVLTPEIYATYIQGNNDRQVASTLLCHLDVNMSELSELKDRLFLEHLNQIRVIDGVVPFLESVREEGYPMCIVTNCNHRVAEAILEEVGIADFFAFIVASDDCTQGKPHPEPYKRAMKRFGATSQECTIFEDSKAGILSAQSVHPYRLVGVETIYTASELRRCRVTTTIRNYTGLRVDRWLEGSESMVDQLTRRLLAALRDKGVVKVVVDTDKLKGGFIADVVQFEATDTDDVVHHYIYKYETKSVAGSETTNLARMAHRLDLYQREYYFYREVAPHVVPHLQIPKFITLVENDTGEVDGIVLENLATQGMVLNLNLNTEPIEVTLKVIARMARMHSRFWGKDVAVRFPGLKTPMDPTFCPFFETFIQEKYPAFREKWGKMVPPSQTWLCDSVVTNFTHIQERLAKGGHLTVIHGDIKSPNIFYDRRLRGDEPYFLDWQHCGVGKGAQDLVFFILESFDIGVLHRVFKLATLYYYQKLMEYGVKNYSWKEYSQDLKDAVCYIPLFTGVWFGTTPQDELIDPNFPFFFIRKMMYLMELTVLPDEEDDHEHDHDDDERPHHRGEAKRKRSL